MGGLRVVGVEVGFAPVGELAFAVFGEVGVGHGVRGGLAPRVKMAAPCFEEREMQAQRQPGLMELDAKARVAARRHLDAAVEDIDEKFGAGTAAAHPALVAGYIQTIAAEYLGGVTKWYLGDHVEALHHVAVDINRSLMDVADQLQER